jgi:hypothetical protein
VLRCTVKSIIVLRCIAALQFFKKNNKNRGGAESAVKSQFAMFPTTKARLE